MKVALTGGFGSGKSTVAELFRKKGARLIDSDVIVHHLFAKSRSVRAAVRRRFGKDVFTDGELNRTRMAEIVFSDPAGRRALERIVHPAVRREIRRQASASRARVTVVDIPLLFESGWKEEFDAVVVVTASVARRTARLKGRGFTAAEARRRMRAQLPLSEKVRRADHVIDNDGTRKQTRNQIDELWKTLCFRKDV